MSSSKRISKRRARELEQLAELKQIQPEEQKGEEGEGEEEEADAQTSSATAASGAASAFAAVRIPTGAPTHDEPSDLNGIPTFSFH